MGGRHRRTGKPSAGGAVKMAALIFAVCAFLGFAARAAAGTEGAGAGRGMAVSESAAEKLVLLALGISGLDELDPACAVMALESPLLSAAYRGYAAPTAEAVEPAAESVPDPPAPPRTPAERESRADPGENIVETTITGAGAGYQKSAGMAIKNKSIYEIDVEQYLSADVDLKLDPAKPQVLIIHTHGSEAYAPAGEDLYVETDPSRTEDRRFNVIRVGDELAAVFEARGIAVLHDRELYDYPSYSGSYNRSLAAIENYLKAYPDIKIVIDLHRDALIAEDGTVYKTVCTQDGEVSSQVMILVGTDSSGLNHPNWRKNLALAVRLQAAMMQKYPTLARPLTISEYRYNQHATAGSMILEVGCNGNTLQEALLAVRRFGDAASDVLLGLGAP